MNAFLKTTLKTVQEDANRFEQQSKEWERLYFETEQKLRKVHLPKNERLTVENRTVRTEVEAGRKKLGAIQDFFLTTFLEA